MMTLEGRDMGQHAGLMYYTIGQRVVLELVDNMAVIMSLGLWLEKDLSQKYSLCRSRFYHDNLMSTSLDASQVHFHKRNARRIYYGMYS